LFPFLEERAYREGVTTPITSQKITNKCDNREFNKLLDHLLNFFNPKRLISKNYYLVQILIT